MKNKKLYTDKDWLYDQYIIKNKSTNDIAKEFNLHRNTICKYLKKFNITKDKYKKWENKYDKMKKTSLEKHGVDNIFKKTDYIEQCRIKKLGVKHNSYLKETIERRRISFKNHSKEKKEEIKNKNEQTNLKKFGVICPLNLIWVKEKCHSKESENKKKETCLNKYGVEYVLQLEDIREKQKKKITEDRINIKQKEYETKKNNKSYGKSKSEDLFYEYLKDIDPNTQRQICINGLYIDFYLPNLDIYIEFDGDYWHGYLNTKEELEKSKQGKSILRGMEKDKIKNELIPNLIRIKESQFLKMIKGDK